MKKLALLFILLLIALVAYKLISTDPEWSKEDIEKTKALLQNELYAKNKTPGKYQFEAEGKVFRYWTVSDVLNLNRRAIQLSQDKKMAQNSPALLFQYSTSGDGTTSEDSTSSDLTGTITNELRINLNLNCQQLEQVLPDCDCTTQYTDSANENPNSEVCKPPTGDQSEPCSPINEWGGDGMAAARFINDFPWLLKVNPKLHLGDKIIPGKLLDDKISYSFNDGDFGGYQGKAIITTELTVEETSVGSITLPFVLK